MDAEHAKHCRFVNMGKYIWNKQGLPHKGWSCVNVVDSGHASSKCEMCGNGTVRYLHYLEHDEFDGQLKVGSECSQKLAENYSNASAVEDYIKRYPKEKEKWPAKWKKSKKGNTYFVENEYPKERLVTVFPDKQNRGRFKYSIIDKEYSTIDYGEGPVQEIDERKQFSKESYSSIIEAQFAVFDKLHTTPERYAKHMIKLF